MRAHGTRDDRARGARRRHRFPRRWPHSLLGGGEPAQARDAAAQPRARDRAGDGGRAGRMNVRLTMQIARYGVRDLVRSRWVLGYAAFFALATFVLLRFSDSETKALLSLTNVVLLVVPL